MNERTCTIALLAHSFYYVATCGYRRANGGNSLFPEEAEILQRVQQDVGHILSECRFLCCCVLGQQHQSQDKIIKKAGSVLGLRLESFETVVERRTLNKLLSIMDNNQHPLHHTVVRQRSTFSHSLLQLRC